MLLFLFRFFFFFFSSRRRHTRCLSDWSSDVCSSDLSRPVPASSDHDRWRLQCAKLSLLPTTSCRRTSPRHHESMRSEERRVGKECRSRREPDHEKKKEKRERCSKT